MELGSLVTCEEPTCSESDFVVTDEIRRLSASAGLELGPHGVLTVRLSGLLTSQSMTDFRAVIGARCGPEVRAGVVDFRRGLVTATAAQLDEVLSNVEETPVLLLPVALLVPPDAAGLFSAYALRAASMGLMRRVFVAEPPALAWASAEAQRAPVGAVRRLA